MVSADRTPPGPGMLSSQMVCPCDPMASKLSATPRPAQKPAAAAANASPSCTLTSDSSSGVVARRPMSPSTRHLSAASTGTSSYASSSKFIAASGSACRNRHSTQSMASMDVPELSPSTVRSSGADESLREPMVLVLRSRCRHVDTGTCSTFTPV